jgi:hypothetical protein
MMNDDRRQRQRWLSTPSSSVATIIIRDIIMMVPMAVEQTSTRGKKEPWNYQGNDNWPLVGSGLSLDRPSGCQLST